MSSNSVNQLTHYDITEPRINRPVEVRKHRIAVLSETTSGVDRNTRVAPTTIDLAETEIIRTKKPLGEPYIKREHNSAYRHPALRNKLPAIRERITPAVRKNNDSRDDYRLDDLSDVHDRVRQDGLDTVEMQRIIPKMPNKAHTNQVLTGAAQGPHVSHGLPSFTEWGTVGDVISQLQQIDLFRLMLLVISIACILGTLIDVTATLPLQWLFTLILTITIVLDAVLTLAEIKDFTDRMKKCQNRLHKMTPKEMVLCYLYNTDRSFYAQDMRQFARPINRSPNLPRNRGIRINVMREFMSNPKTFHCTYDDSQTYGRRTYLDINLQGVAAVSALLDTGSTSSVIDSSLLAEIEAKLGFRLPRIDVDTRLIGFLEDVKTQNSGCVSIDITIENDTSDKQLILHKVPVYIVSGTSSRFILGQNVIAQQCDVLGFTGHDAYVTLKDCPQFGKATIHYLHDDTSTISLEPVEDIYLNPKEAKVTALTVRGSQGRQTNLDFKPLYLTDEQGRGSDTHMELDFPDTLQLKKGSGRIMLRNTTSSPQFYAKRSTILLGTLINTKEATDVTPVVTAISNYQDMDPQDYKKCPCQLTEEAEVAFISDHHGYTYQGYSLRNIREDRNLESYNAGVYKDNKYFYLVPGDRMNFEPLRDSPISEIIQKWKFKNKRIFVCFTEHILLTDALLEFLQSLNRHVNVKLAQIDERDYCDKCKQKSPSALVRYKELKHTKRLNVIFPSQYAIKGESKKTQRLLTKLQGADKKQLLITDENIPTDFYISGPHEATLFVHIPVKHTGQENITIELARYVFSELSRAFPRASIQLFTNTPHTHVYRTWLLKAFKLARFFYFFPEIFQPSATRRWNVESDKQEDAKLKREKCACSLCVGSTNDNNAYEFQLISAENWPTMTLEESLLPNTATVNAKEADPSGAALVKLINIQRPHTVAALGAHTSRGLLRPPSLPSQLGSSQNGEFRPGNLENNNDFNDNRSSAAVDVASEDATHARIAQQTGAESIAAEDDSATPAYARQVSKIKKRDIFEEYDDNSIAAEVNTQYGADKSGRDETNRSDYVPLREVQMSDLIDPGPYKQYSGIRGQRPLPAERRKTVTIDQIDEYFDFSRVNSSKVITALRLFLFAYRDILQLDKEYDFSYIKVLAARLYPRPECKGMAFHSRPYPATNDMLAALDVFVQKKLAQGVFTHSSRGLTLHSYSAFLVVKSSDVRMAKNVHAKSDIQKLDLPVEKKWRFVIDASSQQRRLLDTYNQTILRNLNHLSIGDHVNRGTNKHGRGIISTVDASDAFGKTMVDVDSRKYNGVSLPGGVYQSVQMIQGSFLSPSIFVQSLNRALRTETKESTLVYMDDLLINNAVVTNRQNSCPKGSHTMLHHPSCHNLECNACTYVYKADYEIDRAYIAKNHDTTNTFKPHDISKFMAFIKKADLDNLLPVSSMAVSYFSPGASLDKGQNWENAIDQIASCPTYEVEQEEDWTIEEIRNHFVNLDSLFSDLRNAGISISATKEKLQLFRSRLKYFGHYYTTANVELSQERQDYFEHFRVASTVKDARKFAGSVNFISGFAADIPYLLRPLNCSLGLADKHPLSDLQKQSINKIIDIVQKISGLPLLPSDAQLVVYTDSSLLSTGICAGHIDCHGKFNPCIFYTKNFDACISRSTSAIEREFLGISMFLKLHPEATQRRKRTIFVTDSRGIHLLWGSEKVNTLTSRVGRAVLFLKSQPLNIRVIHRPSTNPGIIISDALSRELNSHYMAQDSVIRREVAEELKTRQNQSGPIYVDSNKLLPTELVKNDLPVENLDILRDYYMKGFLTKAKRYSDDTFEDVLSQMRHNQFPDKREEQVESVYELPRTEHSDKQACDVNNAMTTHSLIERHSWCKETCGAIQALEHECTTLDTGAEALIMQVHKNLITIDNTKNKNNTDKKKKLEKSPSAKEGPSNNTINERLLVLAYGKIPSAYEPSSQSAQTTNSVAATTDKVKSVLASRKPSHKLGKQVDKENTASNVDSVKKLGFFELTPAVARHMPYKTSDASTLEMINARTKTSEEPMMSPLDGNNMHSSQDSTKAVNLTEEKYREDSTEDKILSQNARSRRDGKTKCDDPTAVPIIIASLKSTYSHSQTKENSEREPHSMHSVKFMQRPKELSIHEARQNKFSLRTNGTYLSPLKSITPRRNYLDAKDNKAIPLKSITPRRNYLDAKDNKAIPLKSITPRRNYLDAKDNKAIPLKSITPRRNYLDAKDNKAIPLKSLSPVAHTTRACRRDYIHGKFIPQFQLKTKSQGTQKTLKRQPTPHREADSKLSTCHTVALSSDQSQARAPPLRREGNTESSHNSYRSTLSMQSHSSPTTLFTQKGYISSIKLSSPQAGIGSHLNQTRRTEAANIEEVSTTRHSTSKKMKIKGNPKIWELNRNSSVQKHEKNTTRSLKQRVKVLTGQRSLVNTVQVDHSNSNLRFSTDKVSELKKLRQSQRCVGKNQCPLNLSQNEQYGHEKIEEIPPPLTKQQLQFNNTVRGAYSMHVANELPYQAKMQSLKIHPIKRQSTQMGNKRLWEQHQRHAQLQHSRMPQVANSDSFETGNRMRRRLIRTSAFTTGQTTLPHTVTDLTKNLSRINAAACSLSRPCNMPQQRSARLGRGRGKSPLSQKRRKRNKEQECDAECDPIIRTHSAPTNTDELSELVKKLKITDHTLIQDIENNSLVLDVPMHLPHISVVKAIRKQTHLTGKIPHAKHVLTPLNRIPDSLSASNTRADPYSIALTHNEAESEAITLSQQAESSPIEITTLATEQKATMPLGQSLGQVHEISEDITHNNTQTNTNVDKPTYTLGPAEDIFIASMASVRHISEEAIATQLRGINAMSYFSPTKVQEAQLKDERYSKIIKMLITLDPKKVPARVRNKYTLLPTNLLAEKYRNNLGFRICVPTESAILLVAAAHGSAHLSTKNVYALLRTYFKISHLQELTTLVGQNCLQCAYNNPTTKREQIPGHVLHGRSPLDIMSCDHMFVPANSRHNKVYRYLFTYADSFTKMVTVVPTITTSSKEVIDILRQIFMINGKPNTILSDRGAAFTSASYESFMRNEGVKAVAYMSYVPNAHGIERSNLLVKQVINILLTSHHSRNWIRHIVQINDILRALPQKYIIKDKTGTVITTQMSAYEFTYGKPPPRSLDAQISDLFEAAPDENERAKVQTAIHKAAADYFDSQAEEQDKADEEYATTKQRVKVGSYVLLRREPSSKYLTTYFKMPYRVTHIDRRKIGLIDPWANSLRPFSVHIHRIKPLNINASLFAELPQELRIALGAADALLQERTDTDTPVLPLQSVINMKRGKIKRARKASKKATSKTGSKTESATSSKRVGRIPPLRDVNAPRLEDLGNLSLSSTDSDHGEVEGPNDGPPAQLLEDQNQVHPIPLANVHRQAVVPAQLLPQGREDNPPLMDPLDLQRSQDEEQRRVLAQQHKLLEQNRQERQLHAEQIQAAANDGVPHDALWNAAHTLEQDRYRIKDEDNIEGLNQEIQPTPNPFDARYSSPNNIPERRNIQLQSPLSVEGDDSHFNQAEQELLNDYRQLTPIKKEIAEEAGNRSFVENIIGSFGKSLSKAADILTGRGQVKNSPPPQYDSYDEEDSIEEGMGRTSPQGLQDRFGTPDTQIQDEEDQDRENRRYNDVDDPQALAEQQATYEEYARIDDELIFKDCRLESVNIVEFIDSIIKEWDYTHQPKKVYPPLTMQEMAKKISKQLKKKNKDNYNQETHDALERIILRILVKQGYNPDDVTNISNETPEQAQLRRKGLNAANVLTLPQKESRNRRSSIVGSPLHVSQTQVNNTIGAGGARAKVLRKSTVNKKVLDQSVNSAPDSMKSTIPFLRRHSGKEPNYVPASTISRQDST